MEEGEKGEEEGGKGKCMKKKENGMRKWHLLCLYHLYRCVGPSLKEKEKEAKKECDKNTFYWFVIKKRERERRGNKKDESSEGEKTKM